LIEVHIAGKIAVIPKRNSIPPEIVAQTPLGMLINNVVPLRRRLKTITDRLREAVITNGRALLFVPTDPPRMTGRSVITHGANTVNIPASMEEIREVIY
jgi:hypothetical protein